jgi:hypothetical protein
MSDVKIIESDPVLSDNVLGVSERDRFNLSPLVRITLLSLYFALTVPLPYLADATQAAV